MSYYAGFSALGLRGEPLDSELITIIESPENPLQIGYATPIGPISGDGLQPYTLCLFGDRRPVAGNWFLKDGQFQFAEDSIDRSSGAIAIDERRAASNGGFSREDP